MKKLLATLLAALLLALPAQAQLIPIVTSYNNAYMANAVTFNGTTSFLSKAANLTGIAGSKSFTFSFWFKPTGTQDTELLAFYTAGGAVEPFYTYWDHTQQRVCILGQDSTATTILSGCSAATSLPANTAHGVLISVDLATGGHYGIEIDGSLDGTAVGTFTNGTIDFAHALATPALGSSITTGFTYNGDMADVWFTVGTYIDVSSNYSKFFNGSNKPINKGADGSLPTGTAPLLFLSSKAASYGTNSGTGGNMTINGSFTDNGHP